uniref:Piezo non-specific cation channel R-Ras-binding domain-containing protein n=1 Tax=Oryza nivara TaxID=4536 RepID=A0A0E0FIX4_ORYNI
MAWRTGGCAGRCLLPLVLLAASLLDWSLISLVNMIFFFAIRFVAPRRVLASLAQVTFHLIWCIEGEGWVVAHSWWAKLVGFASCIGVVDWSLTSNFLGLFRWWRLLEIYSVFIILLLYVYQLPVKFPYVVLAFADFIGLFKISSNSEWPEVSSGISLLFYYFMFYEYLVKVVAK